MKSDANVGGIKSTLLEKASISMSEEVQHREDLISVTKTQKLPL